MDERLEISMLRIKRLQRRRLDLSLSGGGDSAEAEQIKVELRKLEPLRLQYIKQRFF